MKTSEAEEMYLETILILSIDGRPVRMIDIAKHMSYSKPTVSVLLKKFREKRFVETDENGFVSLTDRGRAIAERIYDRHQSLARFFMALGVSEETAVADACKMEHDISDETYARMKEHFKKHGKEN